MNQKQTYLSTINDLKEISAKHRLPNELIESLKKLELDVQNFTMKVPVIGGFNAGKSSMINTFLSTDLLPVEITPETAIAAEIKYGDNRIIAHNLNGETQPFAIEDIKKIDANEFKYIEVYMENQHLHSLKDVTIVDMPGFDSGINEHNKAIFQYLKEGVVFVIVVDCEDGSVKSSVLNFLYELDMYQLNYAVIVNKIDQKPQADIDRIVANIKGVIGGISENIIVETASDRLENGNQGFLKAVQSFNKEEILKKKFESLILQVLSRIKMNLDVIIKNSDVDVNEINQRIQDIELKLKGLTERFKKEEAQMSHHIRHVVKDKILNDVQAVLLNESSSLALSAKAGETSFNHKVNELVRPVLIASTNQHLEMTFSEIVSKLSKEMVDATQIAQGISQSTQKIGGTLHVVQEGLEKIAENQGAMKKFEKLYKVSVGGLAIITGVVAPWMELIIFFLPDILKVFGVGNEERHLEKLKDKMETEIIPQIITKISGNIEDNLENVKNEFLTNFKQEMEEEMNDLSLALQQSIENKQQKEQEFAVYLNDLKEDIEKMEQLREQVLNGGVKVGTTI